MLSVQTTWAGALIVADSSQILRFNAQTGAYVTVFDGGLSNPHGLFLRGDGTIFVGEDGPNTVASYGLTGALLGPFVTPGSGGLNSPQYITSGPDGNLYVSSTFSDQVLRYNGTTG